MKTILALWWFVAGAFFAAFVLVVKGAGGDVSLQTTVGLALTAALCGAIPAVRLALLRSRDGTLDGSQGPVRLLIAMGLVGAGIGTYAAAHRSGGLGHFILLAGLGLVVGALGVAIKRHFATPR